MDGGTERSIKNIARMQSDLLNVFLALTLARSQVVAAADHPCPRLLLNPAWYNLRYGNMPMKIVLHALGPGRETVFAEMRDQIAAKDDSAGSDVDNSETTCGG